MNVTGRFPSLPVNPSHSITSGNLDDMTEDDLGRAIDDFIRPVHMFTSNERSH